ncbi:putative GPI-anchored protein pfl2 [Protopterus annectens]|uniref:putative GPI-anchored protein pfl2 n=1 Tax=Protopterus annectens TaxID=7888 RepID=UPI001CFBD12F|nr:putative GPI-anchored protein pfl2 [Protopterus annectens]
MLMELRWRTLLVCFCLFASGLCPGSWGDHDGMKHKEKDDAVFHETSSPAPSTLPVSIQVTRLSNSSVSTETTVLLFTKTSLAHVSSHAPSELNSGTEADHNMLYHGKDSRADDDIVQDLINDDLNSKTTAVAPKIIITDHGISNTLTGKRKETVSASPVAIMEMKSHNEDLRGDSSRWHPVETTVISEVSSMSTKKGNETSLEFKNITSDTSTLAGPITTWKGNLETASKTESTRAATTPLTTSPPPPLTTATTTTATTTMKHVTTVSITTTKKTKAPGSLQTSTTAAAATSTTHATTIIVAPAGSIQDPSILDIGDDRKDLPSSSKPFEIPTDPLVIAVISVFVIMIGILALVVFLRYRQKNNRTEFRRLQDLPMDDMMEDAPLSLYSY